FHGAESNVPQRAFGPAGAPQPAMPLGRSAPPSRFAGAVIEDPSARPSIARVEPLTRTRAVRGPFDYRIAPGQDHIGVGSLLRVPFGRQRTLGVVTELADSSELAPERLS